MRPQPRGSFPPVGEIVPSADAKQRLEEHDVGMTDAELLTLAEQLDGQIAVPSDERWDAARQAWGLPMQAPPRAVALPQGGRDLARVVEFARSRGLRVEHREHRTRLLLLLDS
jgi:hypothetical protein